MLMYSLDLILKKSSFGCSKVFGLSIWNDEYRWEKLSKMMVIVLVS